MIVTSACARLPADRRGCWRLPDQVLWQWTEMMAFSIPGVVLDDSGDELAEFLGCRIANMSGCSAWLPRLITSPRIKSGTRGRTARHLGLNSISASGGRRKARGRESPCSRRVRFTCSGPSCACTSCDGRGGDEGVKCVRCWRASRPPSPIKSPRVAAPAHRCAARGFHLPRSGLLRWRSGAPLPGHPATQRETASIYVYAHASKGARDFQLFCRGQRRAGDCSPSRRVVSNMRTWVSIVFIPIF